MARGSPLRIIKSVLISPPELLTPLPPCRDALAGLRRRRGRCLFQSEYPCGVAPADLRSVVVAQKGGVEPACCLLHCFVGVVDREHHPVGADLVDRAFQGAGVEVPARGEQEVAVEVAADRLLRRSQAGTVTLPVKAVFEARQREVGVIRPATPASPGPRAGAARPARTGRR